MGCDLFVSPTGFYKKSFNPRTHVGCDGFRTIRYEALHVSIHAPTWGATPSPNFPFPSLLFQSTHPRGVRRPKNRFGRNPPKFQSTHPRGVRHAAAHVPVDLGQVSIHAPTWGATFRPSCRACKRRVSIHAPTWGATSLHPPV